MAEMHPKQAIHDSETCFGVPREAARKLAGLDEHMGSSGGEIEGTLMAREVRQALRRINSRLELLRRTRFAGG